MSLFWWSTPKEELMDKLKSLAAMNDKDVEMNHVHADEALIEFIDDPEIAKAYNKIKRWFA